MHAFQTMPFRQRTWYFSLAFAEVSAGLSPIRRRGFKPVSTQIGHCCIAQSVSSASVRADLWLCSRRDTGCGSRTSGSESVTVLFFEGKRRDTRYRSHTSGSGAVIVLSFGTHRDTEIRSGITGSGTVTQRSDRVPLEVEVWLCSLSIKGRFLCFYEKSQQREASFRV